MALKLKKTDQLHHQQKQLICLYLVFPHRQHCAFISFSGHNLCILEKVMTCYKNMCVYIFLGWRSWYAGVTNLAEICQFERMQAAMRAPRIHKTKHGKCFKISFRKNIVSVLLVYCILSSLQAGNSSSSFFRISCRCSVRTLDD